MTDSELREHLHARGWRTEAIDVPMIREACKALQEASATGAEREAFMSGLAWMLGNRDTGVAEWNAAADWYANERSTPTTSTTGKVDASRVRDEAMGQAEPHPAWCSCGACNPEDAETFAYAEWCRREGLDPGHTRTAVKWHHSEERKGIVGAAFAKGAQMADPTEIEPPEGEAERQMTAIISDSERNAFDCGWRSALIARGAKA